VSTALSWTALAALGAYHGANPGMGWLFAVALGLQQKSGRAVLEALPPIALGHALAIGATLAAFAVLGASIPLAALKWSVAALLVGFGVLKLIRPRHPRWVGMRVGFRDLTWWSFLMASAHGAGLMVLPIFLIGDAAPGDVGHHAHHGHGSGAATLGIYLAAIAVHTGAMLAVAGAIALVVYHRLGLGLLRRSWFNLEQLWAAALIIAGLSAAIA
jgi:hypothetical protein